MIIKWVGDGNIIVGTGNFATPGKSRFTSWPTLTYCMPKKSGPNIYRKLLYDLGQDFFDIL